MVIQQKRKLAAVTEIHVFELRDHRLEMGDNLENVHSYLHPQTRFLE